MVERVGVLGKLAADYSPGCASLATLSTASRKEGRHGFIYLGVEIVDVIITKNQKFPHPLYGEAVEGRRTKCRRGES
jgi:hypothetical protein